MCNQLKHDKVNSRPKSDLSYLSSTADIVVKSFGANTKEVDDVYKVFDERLSKNNMSWNVFIAGYNQEEDCVCIMTNQYQPKYNDSGRGTGIPQLAGSHVTPTSFNRTTPSKTPLWHCHTIVCLSQQLIEIRNGEVPKQVTFQFQYRKHTEHYKKRNSN